MSAPAPMDRPALLAALRARIARLEGGAALARGGLGVVPLAPALDAHLPAGGLERGALHDVLAADPGAAAGFCAIPLGRAGGPVLWVSAAAEAWAPGLSRFGLSPAELILVRAEGADALWAMEEILRCPAVAGALLEAPGVPPKAARRLQLAAEAGGGVGLLLRGAEAPALPGVRTAWRVAAAEGEGAAHDLGDATWRVELLRARAAPPAAWGARWHEARSELEAAPEAGAAPERRRVRA